MFDKTASSLQVFVNSLRAGTGQLTDNIEGKLAEMRDELPDIIGRYDKDNNTKEMAKYALIACMMVVAPEVAIPLVLSGVFNPKTGVEGKPCAI